MFISDISQLNASEKFPFSTNETHITVWNGNEYVPVFIKGINLGISYPGTYPGDLGATHEDYLRWFEQIKEAGFNCIRLYTLHYPRYYEALREYNLANPQNPLFFFQGVWLEEEMPNYDSDLYFLTETFTNETEENIDCVHGNRVIPQRFGKAYGEYNADVSQWCMGYIMGREIHPHEVIHTNEQHLEDNSFDGNHFSITNASATEAWFTKFMDYAVEFETENYDTSRPVCMSSWPTLDPLNHPTETHTEEDIVGVDIADVEIKDAPAGMFVSYHAYPYYPDFVSKEPEFLTYFDDFGSNSYLGYLTELNEHYTKYPLIIAEYGVPTSWMIAHYSSSSMNHGGFDEVGQGKTSLRLLQSIETSGCGGGIQFAWIDEWFKRTWICDPLDYEFESRALWQNTASAEQCFGLVAFEKNIYSEELTQFNELLKLDYISAEANTGFFEFEIGLKDPLDIPDEMWVAIDTYDENLGESMMPNGETIPTRSEFLLHITNYTAELYVTKAYDTFGIWHGTSLPEQIYQSTVSDGEGWKILRKRNNSFHSEVQYIGNLQVNWDFQLESSRDAVSISDEKIHVKLPWNYLHVVAPNNRRVLHDDRSTNAREDIETDGFKLAVYYKGNWFQHNERFLWDTWDGSILNNYAFMERKKQSYYIMKEGLTDFNTPAIAVRDSFYFEGPDFPAQVESANSFTANDFDFDGNDLTPFIIKQPSNGMVYLEADGSFKYYPDAEFVGLDTLSYVVYDGYTLSDTNTVQLFVKTNNTPIEDPIEFSISKNYPNPFSQKTKINYSVSKPAHVIIKLYNIKGQLVDVLLDDIVQENNDPLEISAEDYASGVYVYTMEVKDKKIHKKMIIVK
jgi:hypothetical protein